ICKKPVGEGAKRVRTGDEGVGVLMGLILVDWALSSVP
ncbi:MAG: hypothetical protein RLZ51_2007, partial [Pseudomonadota bacterium]